MYSAQAAAALPDSALSVRRATKLAALQALPALTGTDSTLIMWRTRWAINSTEDTRLMERFQTAAATTERDLPPLNPAAARPSWHTQVFAALKTFNRTVT